MLWVLASAKGSPGVTTMALALAAAGSAVATKPNGSRLSEIERVLLVEADPAGGDLECWCGPHGDPGLLAAVTDIRDSSAPERLWNYTVEVVPGVGAILAPTTEPSVTAAFRSAPKEFTAAISAVPGTVVVDLGRWVPPGSTPANQLVRDAATVVVACRSSLASVEHARSLVSVLRSINRRVAVVLVGGDRPYSRDEVAAAVGAPVAGVLPWDPRGVADLVERGIGRAWLRTPLSMAAAELVESLRYLGSAHRRESIHG